MKATVTTVSLVLSVFAAVACVTTDDISGRVDAGDAGSVDATASLADSSVERWSPREADPVDAGSSVQGIGIDGGPICRARCEKAGCADVDACVELCAAESARIPESCRVYLQMAEACVDSKGSWSCKMGAAKGTGPCSTESTDLLSCFLRLLDGGLGVGSATDGGR